MMLSHSLHVIIMNLFLRNSAEALYIVQPKIVVPILVSQESTIDEGKIFSLSKVLLQTFPAPPENNIVVFFYNGINHLLI